MTVRKGSFCWKTLLKLWKNKPERIVLSLLFVLVIFPVSAFCDSEVQVDGNLRLKSGGSLVFSDGTSASSTSSLCTGGCTGTVEGVIKAVHGIYGGSGPLAGNGFSVAQNGTGDYTITFANAFSSSPHCVVSSVGHITTSQGYAACELSSVPGTTSMTVTCMQYIPQYNSGNGTYYYSEQFVNSPFSFICML